jgi:hypothetical protein
MAAAIEPRSDPQEWASYRDEASLTDNASHSAWLRPTRLGGCLDGCGGWSPFAS